MNWLPFNITFPLSCSFLLQISLNRLEIEGVKSLSVESSLIKLIRNLLINEMFRNKLLLWNICVYFYITTLYWSLKTWLKWIDSLKMFKTFVFETGSCLWHPSWPQLVVALLLLPPKIRDSRHMPQPWWHFLQEETF